MSGAVTVDTNLLVLLVVGSAGRELIERHRRLQDYTVDHFDVLVELIGRFSDLIFIPHILAEASSLVQQIGEPALGRVRATFRTQVETSLEVPVPSRIAAGRTEFGWLGLTDAAILHLCSDGPAGMRPTLLTVDGPLAARAYGLECSVLSFPL